jgi:hypothetical protein
MKRQEWGLFTVAALLSTYLFPLYFIEVVAMAVLGGLGILWRSLNPSEKDKLRAFEREFRVGYDLESKGDRKGAKQVYCRLAKKYKDVPKISAIASEWIRRLENGKGKGKTKAKRRRPPAKGR